MTGEKSPALSDTEVFNVVFAVCNFWHDRLMRLAPGEDYRGVIVAWRRMSLIEVELPLRLRRSLSGSQILHRPSRNHAADFHLPCARLLQTEFGRV